MDDPEYKLNEVDEDEIKLPKINSQKGEKLKIILVSIIIFLSLVIVTGIVLYFTVLKEDKEENKGDKQENKEEIFYLYPDIKTSENNKIKNTFGIDGDNHIKEIGNINDGNDYEANDRDNFDLCIPDSVLKNKTNYTTILLDIHGGAWVMGNKHNAAEFCKNKFFKSFIVATMSHTLLNEHYKEYNLFRIIDEITAAIKTLKNFLIQKGFEENKLEIVIQGRSSGAHLSLLYSYMIKNPPIPIKIIINNVGPVTLNPEYFLQTEPGKEPLDNITKTDIENAKAENKLIHMNGSYTGVACNNTVLIMCMNVWLGKRMKDSFPEIFSNEETMELNTNNEKYQELIDKAKHGNPTTYVTKESIPTICLYGGKDEMDGVMQYMLLKEKFDEYENPNISLVYFKYGRHNIYANSEGDYGKAINATLDQTIHRYYQKYLDSYNKN